MILFLIYISAIILCGSINIGPISIRVIATSLMIVYLLISPKKEKRSSNIDNSYIWLYLWFSILMGFALLINGEFIEFGFVKNFLAYNLVSIIAFLAVSRFITTPERVNQLIITLLSIILADSIVTVLQFNGNPIGWTVGYLFSNIDKSVTKVADRDTLLGISATPGIFGDVVKNALYLAVIAPLGLCLINSKNSYKLKIFAIIVILCSCIAAFMTQQRAAFAMLIMIILLSIYILFRKKTILFISILAASLLFILCYSDYSFDYDMGRLGEHKDQHREELASQAIDFIITHPIWGGPVSFINQAKLPAHNLILDSYVYSGLFGFIIMMVLFIKTILKSLGIMIMGMHNKNDYMIIIFSAASVICCMGYGLFHNTSFLSGEVIVFILLAIMLKVNLFSTSTKIKTVIKYHIDDKPNDLGQII